MTDTLRVAGARLPRAVRVPTPGLRARLDEFEGDLVNVSRSGALIRTDQAIPVGSTWTLVLDPEERQIHLVGRVVRCAPLSMELPGGAAMPRRGYAVGVVFTAVSEPAMRAIADLCGGHVGVEAPP